ncbi:prokaryotic phospholipase A2-domain-containing protein [Trichophaea hybrida]|nr:prokaryotic phospholipase A2-domain-containing protein [Trichophaea hybrida]
MKYLASILVILTLGVHVLAAALPVDLERRDTIDLSRDILAREKPESLYNRAVSLLTKRETDRDATDRLLFYTDINTFEDDRDKLIPSTLDWSSDGCTDSPDSPGGFHFLHSCQRHDFGYRNYKKQQRFTDDNKHKIDDNFKKDMYDECHKYSVLKRDICKTFANTYYDAVRAVGNL